MQPQLTLLLIFVLQSFPAHACTSRTVAVSWETASGSGHSPKTMPATVAYKCRNPALQARDDLLGEQSIPILHARQGRRKKPLPGICSKPTNGKAPVQSTRVEGSKVCVSIAIEEDVDDSIVELDGPAVDLTTPHGAHIQMTLDTVVHRDPSGSRHRAMTFRASNRGNCPAQVSFSTPVTFENARRGDPEQGPGSRDLPTPGPNDPVPTCEINNLAITARTFVIVVALLAWGC